MKHNFMRYAEVPEVFSTIILSHLVILSHQLIQEGQLSVSGKIMYTSTG